jgi:hypothetical protein
MNSSTVLPRSPVAKFLDNPINRRVILPDGSLAVVKLFQDTDRGRIYKVQGLRPDGRFRALGTLSCWFTAHELRIVYYTASINPKYLDDQAQADTRNGAR